MYKVMIAEDEEFILEGIANLIDWESFGIQVTHLAVNGQEALKKMGRRSGRYYYHRYYNANYGWVRVDSTDS